MWCFIIESIFDVLDEVVKAKSLKKIFQSSLSQLNCRNFEIFELDKHLIKDIFSDVRKVFFKTFAHILSNIESAVAKIDIFVS